MKLYEIEGFDKGVKVRRKDWGNHKQYVYYDNDHSRKHFVEEFKHNEGHIVKCQYSLSTTDLLIEDDWEVYDPFSEKHRLEKEFCMIIRRLESSASLKTIDNSKFMEYSTYVIKELKDFFQDILWKIKE